MDSLGAHLARYLAGLPANTVVRDDGATVIVLVPRASGGSDRYRFSFTEAVALKLWHALVNAEVIFIIQVAQTIESAISVRVLPTLSDEVRLCISVAAPGVLVATEA